ncbi:FkbM family methyltransferase [Akkermansiaceae bacterium]|nr:FkbM family methyltransferase [bacterium]MDC1205960.1 FkbM family methyltransferase [Akkermansiaceae bacterium]
MKMFRKILRAFGHLRWIKTPLRSRIISRFDDPEDSKEEWFDVRFFGFKYRGNFASCLDWQVYYFGAYAHEELSLIKDVLCEYQEPVMLDVGGNCGHHSLFASAFCKMVMVFEPYPVLYRQITQKMDDNGVQNVRLSKFGLGRTDEKLNFYPPADNHTGLGSFRVKTASQPIELKVRVGDLVVEEENLTAVDFIKIDVEGFEIDVIEGLASTLESFRPTLFIEWSPASRDSLEGELLSEILPPNYECYTFIDNSYTPVLKVFRRPSYALKKVSLDSAPISNLLIGPKEFFARVLDNGRGKLGKRIEFG